MSEIIQPNDGDEQLEDAVVPPELPAEPERPEDAEPGVVYEELPVLSVLEDVVDTNVDKPNKQGFAPIPLLYGTLGNTLNTLTRQEGVSASQEQYAKWSDAVVDGYNVMYRATPTYSPFESTVTRQGGVWVQKLKVDDVTYGARQYNLPTESGQLLTGAAAMAQVSRAIGLGSIIQIPLWHSGIWVSIKAPADVDLYELERRIAMEKIQLGRMTKGLVFSNTSVYIAGHLINFILRHVYSSTAPKDDSATLKSLIRTTDLPSLIWGMVTAIYPGGYPYTQPCVSNIEKCNHVTEALLDITKLQWVDRTQLSDAQKTHMTQRAKRSTAAAIAAYQAEFDSRAQGKNRKLNDQITVELATPSLETYENSGYSWIEAIVRNTDDAFGDALIGKERSDHINDIARTTSARQYSHWISAIEVTDQKGVVSRIEERSSIEANTVQISSSDSVRRAFSEAVTNYIDSVSVSVIGYVNYACPKCGELQLKGTGPRSRIVPIDMMAVFSILQRHKLDRTLKDLNVI